MSGIRSIPLSIPEICADIENGFERVLTARLLELFVDRGKGYLVSATNPKRIYCYVRKSRETMIINKETYIDRQIDGGYSLQIRITAADTYAALDGLSENVRSRILNGRNCKMPYCCNCGHWYQFEHNGVSYRKCHMLCDNYSFSHILEQDTDSILAILTNELASVKPRHSTR